MTYDVVVPTPTGDYILQKAAFCTDDNLWPFRYFNNQIITIFTLSVLYFVNRFTRGRY